MKAPPKSGHDLKLYRLNHGISLDEMSNAIGISKPTLMKAEADGELWLRSRKAIADYFDGLPEFQESEITVTSIWPELLESEAV